MTGKDHNDEIEKKPLREERRVFNRRERKRWVERGKPTQELKEKSPPTLLDYLSEGGRGCFWGGASWPFV